MRITSLWLHGAMQEDNPSWTGETCEVFENGRILGR